MAQRFLATALPGAGSNLVEPHTSVAWNTYHAVCARSTITGRSAILVFNTKNNRRDMWERVPDSCCSATNDSALAGFSAYISVQYREPTGWMFNISNILDNAQFGSV